MAKTNTLKKSTNKTKAMALDGSDHFRAKIFLDGKTLEQVSKSLNLRT